MVPSYSDIDTTWTHEEDPTRGPRLIWYAFDAAVVVSVVVLLIGAWWW